jgi:hypothetical protein
VLLACNVLWIQAGEAASSAVEAEVTSNYLPKRTSLSQQSSSAAAAAAALPDASEAPRPASNAAEWFYFEMRGRLVKTVWGSEPAHSPAIRATVWDISHSLTKADKRNCQKSPPCVI